MKHVTRLLLVVGVLLSARGVLASTTPVYKSGEKALFNNVIVSPVIGTPGVDNSNSRLFPDGNILNTLYPDTNWIVTRVDDDADDQWIETNGGVHIEAKIANDSHTFGFQVGATQTFLVWDDPSTLPIETFATALPGYVATTKIQAVGGGPFTFLLKDFTPDPDKIWSSDPTANSDTTDHMVSWKVEKRTPAPGDTAFYLLAWEDLTIPSPSDEDYNDLVLKVTDVAPYVPPLPDVPAPGSLVGLIGLGVMGLVASWRRRK